MHNMPLPSCESSYQVIPPRVQAAQAFIYWASGVEQQQQTPMGTMTDGRTLTPQERAAYNAALNTLLQYFSGEMDFGGSAPMPIPRQDDEPTSDVPVPV